MHLENAPWLASDSANSVPTSVLLLCIPTNYSIVKDSSADLVVNSKIVQIRPTVKAVSTKISKKNFLHICQYFDISERK